MLEIRSICSNSTLIFINQNSIILFFGLKSDSLFEKISYEHNVEITAATYLPKRNLLAFTDLNKKFHLANLKNNLSILATKSINKRAAKLLATKDESIIILGDKTGDVYKLNLETDNLEKNEFVLEMGHLSMLTDMRLSEDEKFFLTSDRDEKIRISRFPNSYNIEGYLLGHKEFVIQFEYLNDSTLISASGDSHLILWDLKIFKQLQILDVKNLIKLENKTQAETLNGIDRFDFNKSTSQLFAHVFKSNFLLNFFYNQKENKLNYIQKIDLKFPLYDFTVLFDDYYLFSYLEQEKVFFIQKFSSNQFIEMNDQNPLESKLKNLEIDLNKMVIQNQANDLKIQLEKNYLSYFKAIVNNMNDYYQRKQERIKAISLKRKHLDSKSDLQSLSDNTETKMFK